MIESIDVGGLPLDKVLISYRKAFIVNIKDLLFFSFLSIIIVL